MNENCPICVFSWETPYEKLHCKLEGAITEGDCNSRWKIIYKGEPYGRCVPLYQGMVTNGLQREDVTNGNEGVK